MPLDVLLTERAQNELDKSHAWWAQNRSPDQANQWYTGFVQAMLALEENPDVLASIAAAGNMRPSLVVGFAAETDKVVENAKKMPAIIPAPTAPANAAIDVASIVQSWFAVRAGANGCSPRLSRASAVRR